LKNITYSEENLYFTYKKAHYTIYWDDDIDDKILNIVKKYGKYKMFCTDTLKIIKDHHCGDFVLFESSLLKKMKTGNKYYIVLGQNWESDYNGNSAISVLEYNGNYLNKAGNIIITGSWTRIW
jgi:hypothetical protein